MGPSDDVGRKDGPFGALVAALRHFENGRFAEGVAGLRSRPSPPLIEAATRHGLDGLLLRGFEKARAAGTSVPAELVASARRGRFAAAFFAAPALARAYDVTSVLERAGIDVILLKGGARLSSGEADADLHFSSDVDILVHASDADNAVAALRAHGYAERVGSKAIASYVSRAHHRAPLWRTGEEIPVEVHERLCMPGTTSEALRYEEMVEFTRCIAVEGRPLRILDDVGAALHLAYHGRDFRTFRDIVLLSRRLRRMNVSDRQLFHELIARESLDAVRLRGCVAVASALLDENSVPAGHVRTYVSWAFAREDLPAILRKRVRLFETFLARSRAPMRERRRLVESLHRIVYDVVAIPLVVAKMVHRRTNRGNSGR